MTMLMIEGFEQISTSIVMSASQLQYLLLGLEPDEITAWFGDTGDAVQHSASGRVAGNCLRFTRGANAGSSWSAKKATNLGFSFTPKQQVTLGYGLRFSAAPNSPIPLCGFRYDNGSGDLEQISLWATADAKLYISTTPYDNNYDTLTVGLNPQAVSAAGALRFTQWSYIELVVNYAAAIPTVSVLVNGTLVIDGVQSESFLNLPDDPYISSAHIFNPTNSHFGNNTFWQSIDDLYIDDAQTHGPQWVIGMTNGTVALNEGWTGVPSDTYTTAGGTVEGANWNNRLSWELSDLPAGVGTITAIGTNIIASQAATIDALEYGVAGPANSALSKKASVSAGAPDQCLRYVTQAAPASTTLTGPGLNQLRGYLKAAQVVI